MSLNPTTHERLELERAGKPFLGPKRIHLLEKIDQLGSINKAAKSLGMTYKYAWDAIDALNNLNNQPLVISVRGGKQGGGAQLSPDGKRYLMAYHFWEQINLKLLDWWQREVSDQHENALLNKDDLSFHDFFKRIYYMKTSARNSLCGQVIQVKKGAVNAEILLDIDGEIKITAIITNDSVDNLQLKHGQTAFALFKASSVLLLKDTTIKTSARNRVPGVIKAIFPGAVNCEVVIDIGHEKTVVAIITQESMIGLDLKKGDQIEAIVKASSIILAVH